MNRSYSVLTMLIILLGLLIPTGVSAQSTVIFDELRVNLWPEYDRPDVLVIYNISLDPSVSLPEQVTIYIPQAVGEPYNVAMQDVDGMLYNLDYTKEQEGDWLAISFTAITPYLQLEYYDPTIQQNQNERQYKYYWRGDYAVNTMSVQVQQPVNAIDFQISPEMGSGSVAQDGLTYHTLAIGSLDVGTTFSIDLNYEKEDDSLSAGLQPVQPVQPIPEEIEQTFVDRLFSWATGGVSSVFTVIGVLAVLGLLGWAIWYWFMGGNRSKPQYTRQRHKRRSTHTDKGSGDSKYDERDIADGEGDWEPIYCHSCGKRAQPEDAFCRSCGTKLRIE